MPISSTREKHKRQGATLIVILLFMVILVGMVAFAVDVGRMYVVRSQLQSAVDSGALAANMTLKEDALAIEEAVAAAHKFIQLNRVGWGVTVPDGAITVEPGTWDAALGVFTATNVAPTAVRVSARQDDEPVMFGRVFGISTFGVPRAAIASGGGETLDIMLALDLSGSMKSNGRIEALHTAVPAFLDVIDQPGSDDQVGVLGYGAQIGKYKPKGGSMAKVYIGAPTNLFPKNDDWVGVLESDLTSDFSSLRSGSLSAKSLEASKYNGWTPTGAAIRDSAHNLLSSPMARDEASNVIVLMSDGKANKPSGNGPGYALQMAAYAKGNDIKVYTISLGNSADVDLMKQIAAATGAQHFDATGGSKSELTQKLTQAFKDVAAAIKRAQLVQ